MSHNNQKKIAYLSMTYQALDGASIAVSLPIISHMRIQGCMAADVDLF